MKVSVIVPVYNVEKYIGKCLDSLVGQTLKDMEIIVVNDGSMDGSQDIIDVYVEKYDNIVSVRKENGGLSDARNYGLKFAKGQYIAFVDSDDHVELSMFEEMYEKAVTEDVDIVVCDTVMQYEDHSYVLRSNMHFTDDPVRAYVFASPMACTRLVKHTIMKRFAFEKGILYEDLNLTPTYITETRKVAFLEKPMYHYVQRENSIMNQSVFNERLLDIFKVTEHVKDTFVKNGIFEEFHDEIEYLYLIHLLRSATLRFIGYKGTEVHLKRINAIIKKEFPEWRKNQYFRRSNLKFRSVCVLAASRQYALLKMIDKIRR